MQTLGMDQVVAFIQKAMAAGNFGRAEELLFPALDQRPGRADLWFYAGTVLSQRGLHAIALECFRKSRDLDPHPAVWANIAACLRQMARVDECRAVLEQGHARWPEDGHIIANLCGSYVNEGNPEPGIIWGLKAINDPEVAAAAKFNLALLNLELGKFKKGFELYAQGFHRNRENRAYDPDPPMLTPELHASLMEKYEGTNQWPRLLVYGEQGIGDELMFATMLRDVVHDYDVVFDCHPRLESLFKTSHWMIHSIREGNPVTLYPTRKSKERDWKAQCDAKVPIGNLAQFYRKAPGDFPDVQHYTVDVRLVDEYREHLESIANGRPIIGLATRGGTIQTARYYRNMPAEQIDKLFAETDALYVGFDYEDMTHLAEHVRKKFGEGRYVWMPSIVWHWDYHHTAALVLSTDALVTVTQSVAHLSAAMRHPTYVMTPSKPDWRMTVNSGEIWPWYPSKNVRLMRQQGDDWNPAFQALLSALQARSYRTGE